MDDPETETEVEMEDSELADSESAGEPGLMTFLRFLGLPFSLGAKKALNTFIVVSHFRIKRYRKKAAKGQYAPICFAKSDTGMAFIIDQDVDSYY